MTYRNITVNGTAYKYVIGKKFTKVNGVGLILNTDLGAVVGTPYHKVSQRYRDEVTFEEFKAKVRFIIKPSDIRRFILGGGEVDPHFHDGPHACRSCKKTSDDVILRADAYGVEIEQKQYFSYRCNECDHESWMNT